MRIKTYPQAKRAIITQRPKEEIMEFCKEIDSKAWKKIVLKLPPANGFRAKTEAELKERFKNYIKRIGHWSDSDWEIFSDLWVAWVVTQSSLDQLLSEYDNASDFQDETPIPPNSLLDIDCFKYLCSSSESGKVPKEKIKSFYDFGYFKEDPKIDYYISLAKSEFELNLIDFVNNFESLTSELVEQESLNTKFRESMEETQKQNYDKIIASISSLEKDIQALNNYCSELTTTLSKDLENRLSETITLLRSEFSSLGEAVACYDNKVDRQKLTNNKDKSTIFVEQLPIPTDFSKYESLEKLSKALADNYKSIGMKSTGAKQLSKEVLAAVLSQQLISFSGSLASLFARISSKTIASLNTSIFHIPIGLLDEIDFKLLFDQFLDVSSQSRIVSALIIEGVNLSSFEAYAGSLYSHVSNNLLDLNSNGYHSVIFCTIEDGISIFDCPKKLFNCGPIFNTDCLDWRTNWENKKVLNGSIEVSTFINWMKKQLNPPENWDELFEEYIPLAGENLSILWNRCVQKAAPQIQRMNGSSSTMQSLAFGWIIPRGVANGINLTLHQELIAEGNLDAAQPDDRITRLVKLSRTNLW